MKKITVLLGFLCLGLSSGTLRAQEFSANAKAEIAKSNFLPAIEELTTFLQSKPNDEILLTYRANFYAKAGQNDKAIIDATQLIAVNPKSTNGLITLATAKIALGKYHEGIDSLNKALEIQPKLKPALLLRAQAFNRLDQNEKALVDINSVIKDDPFYLEAYVYRGQINTVMERFSAGKDDFNYIMKNSKVGSNYYQLATDEMAMLLKREAESKDTTNRKAIDDAYDEKLQDQVSTVKKDVDETTTRLNQFGENSKREIEVFTKKYNGIAKNDYQAKKKLFKEIHPKVKEQIATLKKELSKIEDKELYALLSPNLQSTIKVLETVLDRTSPYAARKQQYGAEISLQDLEIGQNIEKLPQAKNARDRAAFDLQKRNTLLLIEKLIADLKKSREELSKIDAQRYREKDEADIAKELKVFSGILETVKSFPYD